MRPKRLISLLVAVCMMITMLPLSAVTAFAEDTSSSTKQEAIVDGYKYEYTINTEDGTATITKFRALLIQKAMLILQTMAPTTSTYPQSWTTTL